MLLINSGVEQLAARKAHNLEVGGSSPPPAPKVPCTAVRGFFLYDMPAIPKNSRNRQGCGSFCIK